MNCDTIKELLWAYLENETTAEETAEIEEHLEGCAACREELAQQKELKNALASLPDEELPEGYHTELMQKLQAENKVVPFPVKKKTRGWKQLSMIAAAVLVVVAAGGMKGMLEMRQNQNETVERILFEDTELTADTSEKAAEQAAADTAEQAAEHADAGKDATVSEQGTKKAKSPVSQKTAPKETAKASQPVESAMPKTSFYANEAEDAAENDGVMLSGTRSADSNAADSMTLQVAEKAAALQAIRESIETFGGYEESAAEDVIQAVIPAINYADFLEQVGRLGEIQELFQNEEDGAPRTIRISVTEK